jgi:hypothetical protein
MSKGNERRARKFSIAGCSLFVFLLLCGASRAQQKSAIEVFSASYGLNVSKHALGNATRWVSSACDAKKSCYFAVKDAARKIFDTAPGRSNDFDVVYRCGENVKKGHINAESRNKIVLLTCAD